MKISAVRLYCLNLNFFFRQQQEPETIYLKHVERQSAGQKQEDSAQTYPAPQFMTPLKNVNVNEGELMVFLFISAFYYGFEWFSGSYCSAMFCN